MNHSIHSVDRTTRLKIVVVGLVTAIAMAALTISSHTTTNIVSEKPSGYQSW